MSAQATYSALFQPNQIAGCTLWLDAADTSTLTLSGTSVTAWRDKSSLANNYVQTNASYYPTYVLDTVYNTKGIRFINGTGTHLTPQTPSIYSINSATWTTFVVVRFSDPTINGNVQSISRTVASGNNWIRFHNGTMSFYILTADVQFSRTSTTASGIYSVVVTTSETVYQNGTLAGTGVRGASPVVSDAFNIGGNASSEGMSGFIFEYIVYNGLALSTTQRQQVEGYLAWKWNLSSTLPANHPYLSFAPFSYNQIPSGVPSANYSSWQPTQIAGCTLWLDAADTSTLTLSGTSVTAWRDKSSLSNNYQQTNASFYPTYVLDTVYNAKGIRFINGTGTHLTPQNSSIYSINASSWTTFVVVRFSDPTINGNVQSISRTVASGNNWIRFHNGAMSFYIVTSDVQFSRTSTTASGIYSVVVTSSQTVYQNGTQAGTGARGASPVVTDAFNIGGNASSEGMSGFIFEYIVYNGIGLSTQQRQTVEGYLAYKWGLQGSLSKSNPYSTIPTSISNFPLYPTTTGRVGPWWNPLTMSNCIVWLDPSDTTTLTYVGTNVNQITDKSASAKAFSQSTDSLRPNTSVPLNNLTTLTFPRTATTNCLSATNSANYDNITQYSLFIINRPTWPSNPGAAPAMFGIRSSSVTAFSWHLDGGKGSYIVWNGSSTTTTSFGTQTNETTLLGSVQDSSTMTPYKNGNAGTTRTYSITGTTGLPATYGNSFSSNGEGWQGQMGEVLLYNRALSSSERQQVEGYLAWKWGLQSSLPNTHLYKAWPPPPS